MKRFSLSFSILLVLAVFALNSCSGLPVACTVNCGGGNATITLTLTSLAPTMANSQITSYAMNTTITGITLNTSGGSTVSVPLTPLSFPVELNGAQSSSIFLGSFSVPAGTYNSVTVTLGPSEITFSNQSGQPLTDAHGDLCPGSALCGFFFPAGSFQVQSTPFPIVLSNGQKNSLALRLIGDNAIVNSSGTMSINFSSANAFATVALPRTGTPTGFTDTVENFFGQITAVSSGSVTVQSADGISIKAAVNSGTLINDPFAQCPGNNSTTACLAVNQSVAADFGLDASGNATLLQSDLLDSTPVDEVEGVVIQNNQLASNQFLLVVTRRIVASSNSSMTTMQPGDIIVVTLGNSPLFTVDSAELGNSLPPLVSSSFQSSANLFVTQTVMIQPSAITGSGSAGTLAATTNQVRLRFTELSGFVPSGGLVPPQSFLLNPASPETIFQVTGHIPQIKAFDGVTLVDGVANTSNVAETNPVTTRCMLILSGGFPVCYAAKVRDTVGE